MSAVQSAVRSIDTINEELLPLVRSGDQEACDKLIEANMRLASYKAEAVVECFPHLGYLKDDLVSEGYLALVDAAQRIRDGGEVSHLSGYLSAAIHTAIGHYIDRETCAASDRSVRRDRQQGESPRALSKSPDSDEILAELSYDPTNERDLHDLLQENCKSDEERAIADLRFKGYVDSEIAAQLELPKTTVFMLRRELYQRVVATGEILPD